MVLLFVMAEEEEVMEWVVQGQQMVEVAHTILQTEAQEQQIQEAEAEGLTLMFLEQVEQEVQE